LYFNTGEKDREAYLLIKKSGIPCRFMGSTSDEPTPLLISNYRKFRGLQEIIKFTENYVSSDKQ
jgi:hypothetical protein